MSASPQSNDVGSGVGVHQHLRSIMDAVNGSTREESSPEPRPMLTEQDFRRDVATLIEKLSTAKAIIAQKDTVIEQQEALINKLRLEVSRPQTNAALQTDPIPVAEPDAAMKQELEDLQVELRKRERKAVSLESQLNSVVDRVKPLVGALHHMCNKEVARDAFVHQDLSLGESMLVLEQVADTAEAKMERLLTFRTDVAETLQNVLDPSDEGKFEDYASLWTAGKEFIRKATEQQTAPKQHETLCGDSADRRPLDEDDAFKLSTRSAMVKELLGSLQGIRHTAELSMSHARQLRQALRTARNPTDDASLRYHDVCEISRRVEEVQGRLQWVALNCLTPEERECVPASQLEPVEQPAAASRSGSSVSRSQSVGSRVPGTNSNAASSAPGPRVPSLQNATRRSPIPSRPPSRNNSPLPQSARGAPRSPGAPAVRTVSPAARKSPMTSRNHPVSPIPTPTASTTGGWQRRTALGQRSPNVPNEKRTPRDPNTQRSFPTKPWQPTRSPQPSAGGRLSRDLLGDFNKDQQPLRRSSTQRTASPLPRWR